MDWGARYEQQQPELSLPCHPSAMRTRHTVPATPKSEIINSQTTRSLFADSLLLKLINSWRRPFAFAFAFRNGINSRYESRSLSDACGVVRLDRCQKGSGRSGRHARSAAVTRVVLVCSLPRRSLLPGNACTVRHDGGRHPPPTAASRGVSV